MRMLVVLGLLTTWMSGCAGETSSAACPREVAYTAAQQQQAAVELQALPRDGIIRGTFMPDYGRLRDQARACRGDVR